MAVGGKRIRLGEILIKAGVLEEAQLEEALARQKETRAPIGEILTELGYVTEEKIKYALELQFGVKHVALKNAKIPPEVLRLLPEPLMKQYLMIPVAVNQLTVAMVDPNNILAIDQIRLKLRGVNVIPAVCTESDFWETFKSLPKEVVAAAPGGDAVGGPASTAPQDPAKLPSEIPAVSDQQLKDLIAQAKSAGGEAGVATLLNALMASAVKRRASSLVIEAGEQEAWLRFRIDGATFREGGLPAKLAAPLAQRLKVLAGLSNTSGAVPQHGTFAFALEGRSIKVSFHTMPARHGQVMTLRFFDSARLAMAQVDAQVLHPRVAAALKALLAKPAGMVLVGGPSGSGKSSLLLACLKEVQREGGLVLTVEDPIEYELDGVTQVAVAREPGPHEMGMMAGLEAAFDQGPQALMVGDLGEVPMAQRALRGALGGCLVLAGLPTTQAPLIEAREAWGLSARTVANGLIGTVTLRMLRRLCPHCREAFTPEARQAAFFQRLNGSGQVFRAKGCDQCAKTGYQGQVAAVEVMPFSPPIRDLVARGLPKGQADHLLRQAGLPTLEDYAMWLIAQGHTTMEELQRSDIRDLAQAGLSAEAAPLPGGTGPLGAPSA